MNQISLRTTQLSDIETLLEFEQGVVAAEKPLDTFLGDGTLYYYNIPQLINDKNTHFLVALVGEELVGCGYLKIKKSQTYHKNPKHGYVGFIFVKPSFRGRKVSTFVLESLREWGTEKGLKELRLDVYSNNSAAIKPYERFGFQRSLVNMRIDI
ncbi:Ribosomal-protein-alanine acetyltransferase [Polaribacter irgensii 23-P]|uniref:Ribosomal-protein-alanine acetyltransferase n=1 Tax=Polaribacter irgensii 23-P TaxID=313594 RepID=A4BX37_9FLAO|nr:GNAT family N-acetyltransferase [Polaribacter irgensii]EAR13528.1 Ribosomal-protein-alanine acetyltransferase [Polaribacter irgensii 23-P]